MNIDIDIDIDINININSVSIFGCYLLCCDCCVIKYVMKKWVVDDDNIYNTFNIISITILLLLVLLWVFIIVFVNLCKGYLVKYTKIVLFVCFCLFVGLLLFFFCFVVFCLE